MSNWYLGIDPGSSSGCFAMYNGVDVFVTTLTALSLSSQIKVYKPVHAFLEHNNTSFNQGVSSAGKHMHSYGMCQGVLTALDVPYEQVKATLWRHIAGVPNPVRSIYDDSNKISKMLKEASLNKARELFPTVSLKFKKDHNRAEAMLIALACYKDKVK
jgi:hypothetical protein